MNQPAATPVPAPDGESIPPEAPQAKSPPAVPFPIRGMRYVAGALLVGIIVTVVTATYLRIEQQLQETLERQIGAVLNENVHSVTRWLQGRDALAKSTADLVSVRETARALSSGKVDEETARTRLRKVLEPLFAAQIVLDVAYLPNEGGPAITLEGKIPSEALVTPAKDHRSQYFGAEGGIGQIISSHPISAAGQSPGTLFLSVSALEMSEALDAARQSKIGDTYAFDAQGKLIGSARESYGAEVTFALSATKVRPGQGSSGSPSVVEYQGRSGRPVVGTWSWILPYQVGIATEVLQSEAYSSIARLRQSFLVLLTLVGAAILGFIALGRWTLRVREESLLMTRRLGRLARAIQPLSAALEHDPSAVVLVDAEGQVVYANAASHRVLGVSSALFGQDVDTVFENLPTELQAALDSGRDSIVAKSNGAEDETLLVSSRSLTIDGNPHALYMLRPVTQQVRRQEVEHWKKLIRVLSHELNNALAPITSLLSSARKVNQMTHQDPRLGKIFENIAERTQHLVSFLEGYREVARLPRPDQREMDWESFLGGLSSQKRFRLIGSIPQRKGHFDPSQLERVLVNVLNNAIEADSPPDDVEVEVIDEVTGFRVNVQDRGTGMPEPVLKQAMLPFFSTKRTGTGVGLALSREIIEAHGGQLTLANREGGGLVVSCFLPNPVQPAVRPSVSRIAIAPRNPDETST